MRPNTKGGLGVAVGIGRRDLQSAGLEVMTKVYPSAIIPDKKEQAQMHHQIKKNYRPNNFMTELPHQSLKF
jgi:hypothetical protein